MKKIGLFGGSFNPIHNGHIKIAKEAIKVLKLDKLIFIPCQKNPFKKDLDYVDGQHRMEMIKLVLEDKMDVSSFEIDRKGISYTIDTVKYFKNLYKNDELYLIIGSDNLTKLSKWKDIDEIANLVKIAVFKRKEVVNKINIKKYGGILINNKIYPESSTNFLKGDFLYVDQKVREYIGKEKIYFEQILKNSLSEKRYLHSMHARDFAISIAKANELSDVRNIGFAAMVHDIAKECANSNKEMARKIILKYEPKLNDVPDYKLHQELGYIFLKYYFNVGDEIARAVKVHTSLAMKLSQLDKIVYLADKLCQGRKFNEIQKYRKVAHEDIDKALKMTVEKNIEFNHLKGIEFSKEQEKIYEKWTKK